jgi:ABC-type uncharacterized transport system involved in gliding motility auxiliary subunit
VIFIVLVIFFNIGVSWATTKYPVSIDLTAKHSYKLSSQTINYLRKNLKQKIVIDVIGTKDSFTNAYPPDEKLLEQYPQYNSNITVNYIDTTKNPLFQSKYPKETFADSDIVVNCGSRYKHISGASLVNTVTDPSTYQTTITGYTAEQQLDTAILSVTTNNRSLVTFVTGHGEADSSALQTLLQNNAYTVKTTNLSTQAIDPSTQVIAIVAPKTDFSSQEIKKIDDFITSNAQKGVSKNLFVFVDPTEASMPNLQAYISSWGIGVGDGVVYDQTNSVNSNSLYILNGSVDSSTVGKLPSGEFGVMIESRPLNLLFSTRGNFTTSAVVSSINTSKLANPTGGAVDYSTLAASSSDKSGPFTLMAKSVESQLYNNNVVTSTLMVSGSTQAFTQSDVFSSPQITNGDMIINTFNTITNFKSPLNVEAKDADSTSMTIPAYQQTIIVWLFVAILPIIVVVWGFVVWLRRRHL